MGSPPAQTPCPFVVSMLWPRWPWIFGHFCKRPFMNVLLICKIPLLQGLPQLMPTKPPKAAPPSHLIGYVRVSTAQAKPWSWSGLIAWPAR